VYYNNVKEKIQARRLNLINPCGMTFAMSFGWVLFGVPLVAVIVGWVELCSRWRLETHPIRALIAMMMATAPVVLANGALMYVTCVKPIPNSDYTVERLGLLLSAGAVVAAVSSAKCVRRWVPILTGATSLFMFVLYFLMANTM
jgi:hypothetical protein